MIIKNYSINGLNNAIKAIGLSYGEEFDNMQRGNKLAISLVRRGLHSGESNFLTGVNVDMVVDASIKWWQQAERYHWFQIVMSQSVMHSITHRKISELKFTKETPPEIIDAFGKIINLYKEGNLTNLQLIYSVPVGLKEQARVSTNYLQLLTMYQQRKEHKLPEWKEFCKQVKEMPMMEEFIRCFEKESSQCQ